CVSFILRPSLLPFGFAPWFAPILRRGIHWIADAHRSDERRFIVRVNEKLTAFMEPRSGPSAGRPRGDFCPSWSGQAAARLNCRAATPNAIRVSVINDRVDPVSGTPATVAQTPGWSWVCPNAPPTVTPKSIVWLTSFIVLISSTPPKRKTSTFQSLMAPVGPVSKWKVSDWPRPGVRFVMVCTPSENEKAMGVTNPLKFGARGPANVNIPDTKSLVV